MKSKYWLVLRDDGFTAVVRKRGDSFDTSLSSKSQDLLSMTEKNIDYIYFNELEIFTILAEADTLKELKSQVEELLI